MTKETSNIVNTKEAILSIQINLDGFSFCIYDTDKRISFYKELPFPQKSNSPENHLKQFKALFNHETLLLKTDYQKIIVIHQNELATVVPEELFDEKSLKDYLKHTVKVLPFDFVDYDAIEPEEAKTVYIPYVNINNFLFGIYGNFEYFHSFTQLVKIVKEKDETSDNKQNIYININESSFEIVVLKNNKLQLINTFEFNSPEDFTYHVLFCMEQLGLNRETVPIRLVGQVSKHTKSFKLLYNYVRNIAIKNGNTPAEKNFILANQHAFI